MGPRPAALRARQRDNPVQVLVLHGLPIVAPPTLVAQARPDYIVARSMYEYTLFPPECLFRSRWGDSAPPNGGPYQWPQERG